MMMDTPPIKKCQPRRHRARPSWLSQSVACLLLAISPLRVLGETVAVSYTDIARIFEQRCILCHSGPSAPRGLRLDDLEAVLAGSDNGVVVVSGDPANSELLRRVSGSSMPRMPMTGPPFLAEAEIALIERWILAGLPPGEVTSDTATALALPSAPADEAGGPVTFAQVAPILARRCAKCHAEGGLMGGPPEGYRLNSYSAAVASADRARILPGNPDGSELVRRIRGQAIPRMPFDGPPYLNAEEIRLIEAWVVDGARSTAGEVAPIPIGARVRLHGVLSGRWRLDDLPLNVATDTRIDENLRVGDQVRIRGTVRPDGSIQIQRIRSR